MSFFLINAGQFNDRQKEQYLFNHTPQSDSSTVRPMVMRNGVLVDIKQHNQSIFNSKKSKAKIQGYSSKG